MATFNNYRDPSEFPSPPPQLNHQIIPLRIWFEMAGKSFGILDPHWYRWWKKSCTTWDVKFPVNNGTKYPINWCRIFPPTASQRVCALWSMAEGFPTWGQMISGCHGYHKYCSLGRLPKLLNIRCSKTHEKCLQFFCVLNFSQLCESVLLRHVKTRALLCFVFGEIFQNRISYFS